MNPSLRLIVLAVAALLGFAVAEGTPGRTADPLFEDLARLLKGYLDPAEEAGTERVVVIGLDEETDLRPPFTALPRALWTPQLASVIEGVLDAGASVVALDLVLATTAESVLRGYDRPLLRALRRAADEDKLVLAAVQDPVRPLFPAPVYVFAIRQNPAHIRPANLPLDADGVVRRAPIWMPDGTLGFAAEIARRSGATIPEQPRLILDTDADPTPAMTLSFADVHACLEAGRGEALRERLAGRAVIFGAMLSDSDRFRAANRLSLRGPEMVPDWRCIEAEPVGGLPQPAAGTIAGVQLQALTVDQLLAGRLPVEPPPAARVLMVIVIALLAALPLTLLGAAPAALALTAILVLAPLPAAAAVLPELVLPAGRLTIAAATAAVTALVLREALVGRALRRLRRGFALYLPRPEVERMLALGMPELGGEMRDVTIMFADLAGYTTFAEQSRPPEIVAMLNRHFARLGAAIEAEGGFVLQYLGDGLLAVFGAPGLLPGHATAAVDTALACLAMTDGGDLRLRIGIATGEALVGNIGSPHRFNYAVVGDVVNLAARLEGMNKEYGTGALVSEATARAYAGRHALREIDKVAVVGRAAALTLFTPQPAPDPLRDGAYAIALDAYRAGDFTRAAHLFAALATCDPAASALAARARMLADGPAPAEWDGVFRATRK